jgi:hypothetical protein
MIEQYSNGRMKINEISYDHDLKIIGGQVVAAWWRKSGHRVDADDLKDVLDSAPDIIVIGTGYAENMQVTQALISECSKRRITLIALATKDAVKAFNRLYSKGERVAAAFHLTC